MGRAAARKVGDLAYTVLTGGTSATLTQDGVALFSAATHANYDGVVELLLQAFQFPIQLVEFLFKLGAACLVTLLRRCLQLRFQYRDRVHRQRRRNRRIGLHHALGNCHHPGGANFGDD